MYDLVPVLAAMRDARREYVGADEADHAAVISVRQPPAAVWQYIVDPVQRLRWACVLANRDPDASRYNARGRSGAGAKSHCNHGPADAYREIVDWRPFQYFTTQGTSRIKGRFLPARGMTETFELTEAPEGGTQLEWRVRFTDRGRVSRWTLKLITLLLRGGIGNGAARLERAMEEDLAKLPS